MIIIWSNTLKISKELYLYFLELDIRSFLKSYFYKWTPIFVKGLYSTLIANTALWKC